MGRLNKLAVSVTLHTNRENTQALRSKQAFVTALYKLMARDTYQDLTVTQICQEACVTRQTFYRHFRAKQDILAYDFRACFHTHMAHYPDGGIKANLTHIFQNPPMDRKKLRLLKQYNLFFLLEECMVNFLENDIRQFAIIPLLGTERYRSYQNRFIAATLVTIFSCWTDNDFAESPEELTSLALCMLGGV